MDKFLSYDFIKIFKVIRIKNLEILIILRKSWFKTKDK
jgi:hypothetical protein